MNEPDRLNRLEWGQQCTDELRTSEHPRWQQVRARLQLEDINPDDAALLDYGPDGGYLASGLIRARDGRVFEITLKLGSEEGESDDFNWVFDWQEMSPADLKGIYAHGASLARELLENESPEP
jgi:hypothetical protein